jgi:DNA-binding LytR/AlgR family response regulator
MIRIGICDDERAVHEQVNAYLDAHTWENEFELVHFFDGQELLSYDDAIDILLLDISMPGADGIEVGRRLKKSRKVGRIIMLTSMVERFPEAFEIEAYRFVPKPIEEEKLIRAIEDSLATFIGTDSVEVFQGNLKYEFPQKEISYVSKVYSRTEVIVGNTAFQSTLTLDEWSGILDARMFFQVHRSYIVNLDKIQDIDEEIWLQSGEKLPIARRRKSELMKCYMQYDLRYR